MNEQPKAKDKYILITSTYPEGFAQDCSAAMFDGYFPYGQPFVVNAIYHQAMIHRNAVKRKFFKPIQQMQRKDVTVNTEPNPRIIVEG